jgi:antitoxin ParD1/3/4
MMASSLNLSLTDELRMFVDHRAGDSGLYATPSEYLRDLIRKDMVDQGVISHVLKGIEDVKQGRFSDSSILDILDEN